MNLFAQLQILGLIVAATLIRPSVEFGLTIPCGSRAALKILRSRNSSTSLNSSSPGFSSIKPQSTHRPLFFQHGLCILTMPSSTSAKILNQQIIQKAITACSKSVAIVLKIDGDQEPSLVRNYVTEVYSTLWDIACDNLLKGIEDDLDVIVYPPLPNMASSALVERRPELECLIGSDSSSDNSSVGWASSGTTKSKYIHGQGIGGLEEHCLAINESRSNKNLKPLVPVSIADNSGITTEVASDVFFFEDAQSVNKLRVDIGKSTAQTQTYSKVAVGGTFDHLHYGHKKLLTLAISSVNDFGVLEVGVTSDAMLKNKEVSDMIESQEVRVEKVKNFIDQLAPGLKNRRKVIIINDSLGPPAFDEKFDALVLSQETLKGGIEINRQRSGKGWNKLSLLCCRRTEAYCMSSTAIRKLLKGV